MTLIYAGLSIGAVYALVAIGYNIVFIASHSFNFAQAQLMMIGAFVAYAGYVTFKLPLVAVLALAMVVVAAIAALEERIAIRPVSDHQTQLITTLGFGTVLTGVAQLIWGTQPKEVRVGVEPLSVLGGRTVPIEIALVVLAIALVVAINIYTRRRMGGLALVAMSQDEEAATLRGVDVRKLAFAAFAVTGLLAGLMGAVMAPRTFAITTLGTALALKGFVALAIGGFGSMWGGLIGGFTIGLVEQLVGRYLETRLDAHLSNLSIFVVLLLVLMIKPTGLFGRVQERTV